MAVVVGVASVVMTLTLVAASYARREVSERGAKAGITKLEAAMSRFEAKRGALPKDLDGNGVTTTAEVIMQLKQWALLGDDFSDIDPWGSRYVVVLQRDYWSSPDTIYDENFYPYNNAPGAFQVYSKGPDGATGVIATEAAAMDDVANFSV
jgi:hypothetical protein